MSKTKKRTRASRRAATPCSQCDGCPTDSKLAAAKRIVCREYSHKSYDDLEGDANIVAHALIANSPAEARRSRSLQPDVGTEMRGT